MTMSLRVFRERLNERLTKRQKIFIGIFVAIVALIIIIVPPAVILTRPVQEPRFKTFDEFNAFVCDPKNDVSTITDAEYSILREEFLKGMRNMGNTSDIPFENFKNLIKFGIDKCKRENTCCA